MDQELGHPMEWRPSPGCKVLFENLPLWYLIGNTRGRNLLEAVPDTGSSSKSILLLGCGDIRNVFFTVAALAESSTLSRTGDVKGKLKAATKLLPDSVALGSRCDHLEFHLNDCNPVVLARAILFLILTRDLNFRLPEDLEFYWSLWCHLALTPRQLSRLQEVSTTLAATDFHQEKGTIVIPRQEDATTLKSIWESWAGCKDLPAVEQVVAMRREKIAKHAKTRYVDDTSSMIGPAETLEKVVEDSSQYNAGRTCEGSFMDKGEMEKMQPVVEREALLWHRTGMTQTKDLSRVTSNYVANPTLLDPFSWRWHVHYTANPFVGFMPLPHGCLQQEEYPLTAVCKSLLREQLSSFQAYTRRGGVRFSLWDGDALQLALYDLPRRPVSGEEGGTPNQSVTSTCFDVIDTSNLADYVGLLNLLTCCAPLLKFPSSRLFTATILWFHAAPSLLSYLQRALGTPHVSILPTLLGLRLAFDIQFGSLNPFPSLITGRGASNNDERLISWCLVDQQSTNGPGLAPKSLSHAARKKKASLSPTADPSTLRNPSPSSDDSFIIMKSGSISLLPSTMNSLSLAQQAQVETFPTPCSITAALQEVAEICCKSRSWVLEGKAMARRARGGLHFSSPLTLCLILWSLCKRLSPQSVEGLKWEDLLSSEPLQAPAFLLTLRAMWQHLKGWGGGGADGYKADLGCSPGSKQGVTVYRRQLGLGYHLGIQIGGTPQLRVLLIECTGELPGLFEAAQIIMDALRVGEVSHGYKVHIIDNIQMDTKTTELVFTLPADHRLNKDRVLVALTAIDGFLIGGALPLSEYEEAFVHEQAGVAMNLQSIESEIGIGIEAGGGSGSGKGVGEMALLSVVEYGGAFRCLVGIQVGAEGAVSVEGRRGGEQKTRCCVVKLGRRKVEVVLPWVVDMSASVSIQVMRKRGLISCTFPKATRWPLAVSDHGRVEIQYLPLVKDLPSALGIAMGAMYTLQEMASTLRDSFLSPSTPPFHRLRVSIASIYWGHCRSKAVMFDLIEREEDGTDLMESEGEDPSNEPSNEPDITILVREMRRDRLNRVVAEVVYVDHKRTKAMVARGDLKESVVFENFGKIIKSVKALDFDERMMTFLCSPQELVLFRELLEYNGASVVASDWQKKQTVFPECRASFFIPLEPNGAEAVPGLSEDAALLLGMMGASAPKTVAQPPHQFPSGSGSGFGLECVTPKKGLGIEAKIEIRKEEKTVAEGGLLRNDKNKSQRTASADASSSRSECLEATMTAMGRAGEYGSLEKCGGCGKSGGEIELKKCSACLQVAYCGSGCQRAHWVRHKIDCKK